MLPSAPNTIDGRQSIILNLLADPTSLGLVAVGLASVFIVYRLLFDPLRNIPGPFLTRFTCLWELGQLRNGKFEQVNIDLHKKYGPVVRLAPGRYSIDDRLAAKKIYGHGTKFVKGDFYAPFGAGHPEMNSLFNEQDPHRHFQARRKVASLYAMSTIVSYEHFVDRCTDLLLSKLSLFAEQQEPFDIPTWMQYYAFDVIGEVTVGTSFGMMEHGYDSRGILKSILDSQTYGSFIGILAPKLHPWVVWLGEKTGQPSPVQPILDFTEYHIGQRKIGETGNDRADFLTKLLQINENGNMRDVEVVIQVGSNIAAGSDTTAISLSSAVYYLLLNPSCKVTFQREIDEFQAQGKLSDPVRFSETQQMPYLQAVIKEALRMHPATGQSLARIVPEGGEELVGYHFPAGTDVGVNSWVIHHNREIFGSDADVFRPERWLGPKEDVAVMNENLFTFGSGSRTCIGKNVSLLEMNKALVQIYRKFDIEHADETKSKEWTTRNFWFVTQKFQCRIVPRA